MPIWRKRSSLISLASFFVLVSMFFSFYLQTKPLNAEGFAEPKKFKVSKGESFMEITKRLSEENIIRSSLAAQILLAVRFDARDLKPGDYEFSSQMPLDRIADMLVKGPEKEIAVLIPEGANIFEIDKILSDSKILPKKSLIDFAKRQKEPIEGKLFPDTYRFYLNSNPEEIVGKMAANFKEKVEPLLRSKGSYEENLILASIIEKEVPDFEERRIISGIFKKRISAGMPLQVDASICYIKKLNSDGNKDCYPITQSDLDADFPYNTYLYEGWPKGPISNPGMSAIKAALDPAASPYWFYLSDPTTKKTIFSETLDTHRGNRVKYLLNS